MVKKSKNNQSLQLSVINHCCAAIDVGSMMMMISYNDLQGNQNLLEIDAFTDSLQTLANTLQQAGVTHVAMEATGVYWIAVYEILEQQGFNVTLVNAKHFKNVDAQKTDVKDCQWLHQLHANGLLRGSHIAEEAFRELKSYLHERDVLQQQKSDILNRIHKLLTKMNVKVQHLVSDIEGVSAMRILRAIASGLTDPQALLSVIDITKLKADQQDLEKSLRGNYKKEYIIILKHTLKTYDFIKEQMKTYEQLIEEVLKELLPQDQDGKKPEIKKKSLTTRKNQYSINLKQYLKHIVGVDVTQIEGIDEISALNIISVTGLNMQKWPTAEHFASWLNLSPRPKISGGKVIGHEKRFTNNKASQAFRLAAQTMWQNKGSLGHLYRRLSAQKGSKKATKAIARKLAVILYHMIKNKTDYDKNKLEVNVERQRVKKIKSLQREAMKYGYILQNAGE
ncbi:MAG: IS110 family transposase [Ginsengibacter sp.]